MAMVIKFYYDHGNSFIFLYNWSNKSLSFIESLYKNLDDTKFILDQILYVDRIKIELKDCSIVLNEPIITGDSFFNVKWCKIARVYPDGTEYSISSVFMTFKEFINILDDMVLVK